VDRDNIFAVISFTSARAWMLRATLKIFQHAEVLYGRNFSK